MMNEKLSTCKSGKKISFQFRYAKISILAELGQAIKALQQAETDTLVG